MSALLLLFMGSGFSFGTENSRVLVFSRTAGYRHPLIDAAIPAIQALGDENRSAVEGSEEVAAFTEGQEEPQFEKTVLEQNVTDPMQLAISDDGRVFFIEREGELRVWDPSSSATSTAGSLPVSTSQEDGLLGIALDPGFPENDWLYLYYSPAGTAPIQRLSRFTLAGGVLDAESEKVLLEVPVQREECCHSGGGMAFGSDGVLYLSTGDNTNPFASDGYSPIDERPGRSAWDAQSSSANTHDLRGKILRIRPLPDGSYEIPAGNLFPADGSAGAPEVYVMGVRNPFRFSVDDETGWLYFADVGPDATGDSESRGPKGYDEFNRTQSAGNFGWPYVVADNKPYRDFDFETGQSGGWFDPSAPVNDSPNNTGNLNLPPARPAWIWYPYGASETFPELGSGTERCAFAGPVFRNTGAGEGAFPPEYEGVLFIYDWSRNWIKTVRFDEAGEISSIEPFMSGESFVSPMDMAFGPDGRMYLIEWGEGYSGGSPDAKIVRIDYNTGVSSPLAIGQADPTSGPLPLEVEFTSAGSESYASDPSLEFAWDLDGDGQTDSTQAETSYIYDQPGDYTPRLTVTDTHGMMGVTFLEVFAGNSTPDVTIDWPLNGGVAGFGARGAYGVSVTDAEDSFIDPNQLTVQVLAGHDTHAHPLDIYHSLEGVYETESDGGHGSAANLFTVLAASYTDNGAPGVSELIGRDEVVLQPRRKQAQYFSNSFGLQLEEIPSPESGDSALAYINDGHWASYTPVNLVNIDRLLLRVASGSPGGIVELRHNAPDGPLLGTLQVSNTGGWQSWITMEMEVTDPGDTHELFFVFRGGQEGLLNLNWFEFQGPGVELETYASWTSDAGIDPGAALPGDDPGGYGIPNLLRYAFGLDPHEPDRLSLPQVGLDALVGQDKHLVLTFSRRQGAEDIVYVPEVSANLSNWISLGEEQVVERTGLGNGFETVIVADPEPVDSSHRRFIRVRVLQVE